MTDGDDFGLRFQRRTAPQFSSNSFGIDDELSGAPLLLGIPADEAIALSSDWQAKAATRRVTRGYRDRQGRGSAVNAAPASAFRRRCLPLSLSYLSRREDPFPARALRREARHAKKVMRQRRWPREYRSDRCQRASSRRARCRKPRLQSRPR